MRLSETVQGQASTHDCLRRLFAAKLYRPTEGSRINDRNYQSQLIHGRFNNASDPLSEKLKKTHPARLDCLIKILRFRLLISNWKKKEFRCTLLRKSIHRWPRKPFKNYILLARTRLRYHVSKLFSYRNQSDRQTSWEELIVWPDRRLHKKKKFKIVAINHFCHNMKTYKKG